MLIFLVWGTHESKFLERRKLNVSSSLQLVQPGAIDHSSLFPVSLPFGCSSYNNTSGKLSGEGGFGITFISAKQLLLVLLGQDRTTLNTLVLLTVSAESLPHHFLPSGSSPQGFTRAKDPLFWVLMETRSSLI